MTAHRTAPKDRGQKQGGARKPAPKARKRSGSDTLVLIAAVVLSLAFAAGLYLQAGLEPLPSAIAAAVLFGVSAAFNMLIRRVQSIGQLKGKVERLESEIERYRGARREAAVETSGTEGWQDRVDAANDRDSLAGHVELRMSKAPAASVYGEPDADGRIVGDLVRQLADDLGRGTTAGLDGHPEGPTLSVPAGDLPPIGAERHADDAAPLAAPELAMPGGGGADDLVARAIAARKVEIHLQPILSLAERKARYYEIFPHLPAEDGTLIDPATAVAAAHRLGLRAELDGIVLSRVADTLGRLIELGRARPFFLRLSAAALRDAGILKIFVALMRTHRPITDFLVFELDLDELRKLDAVGEESLESLRSLGFRFAATGIAAEDLDAPALRTDRLAFAKLSADMLEAAAARKGAEPHALVAALRARGLEIVLAGIEDNAALDVAYRSGIGLGQGGLFSEPRPLRTDLQSGQSTSAA